MRALVCVASGLVFNQRLYKRISNSDSEFQSSMIYSSMECLKVGGSEKLLVSQVNDNQVVKCERFAFSSMNIQGLAYSLIIADEKWRISLAVC